jgi:hypothetical protein
MTVRSRISTKLPMRVPSPMRASSAITQFWPTAGTIADPDREGECDAKDAARVVELFGWNSGRIRVNRGGNILLFAAITEQPPEAPVWPDFQIPREAFWQRLRALDNLMGELGYETP